MIIYRVVRLGVEDEHFDSFFSKETAYDYAKELEETLEGTFSVQEEYVH